MIIWHQIGRCWGGCKVFVGKRRCKLHNLVSFLSIFIIIHLVKSSKGESREREQPTEHFEGRQKEEKLGCSNFGLFIVLILTGVSCSSFVLRIELFQNTTGSTTLVLCRVFTGSLVFSIALALPFFLSAGHGRSRAAAFRSSESPLNIV